MYEARCHTCDFKGAPKDTYDAAVKDVKAHVRESGHYASVKVKGSDK